MDTRGKHLPARGDFVNDLHLALKFTKGTWGRQLLRCWAARTDGELETARAHKSTTSVSVPLDLRSEHP